MKKTRKTKRISKIEQSEHLQSYLAIFASEKKPLSVNRIAKYLKMKETQNSCPSTRRLIREAINQGAPIGSNNKGYFILENAKQMQKYLNKLLQRQMALSQRILAVYDAFNEAQSNQLRR